MTLEEAARSVGLFVRVMHKKARSQHPGSGRILGVEAGAVIVQLPNHHRPTRFDPDDLQLWKSRNARLAEIAK